MVPALAKLSSLFLILVSLSAASEDARANAGGNAIARVLGRRESDAAGGHSPADFAIRSGSRRRDIWRRWRRAVAEIARQEF